MVKNGCSTKAFLSLSSCTLMDLARGTEGPAFLMTAFLAYLLQTFLHNCPYLFSKVRMDQALTTRALHTTLLNYNYLGIFLLKCFLAPCWAEELLHTHFGARQVAAPVWGDVGNVPISPHFTSSTSTFHRLQLNLSFHCSGVVLEKKIKCLSCKTFRVFERADENKFLTQIEWILSLFIF